MLFTVLVCPALSWAESGHVLGKCHRIEVQTGADSLHPRPRLCSARRPGEGLTHPGVRTARGEPRSGGTGRLRQSGHKECSRQSEEQSIMEACEAREDLMPQIRVGPGGQSLGFGGRRGGRPIPATEPSRACSWDPHGHRDAGTRMEISKPGAEAAGVDDSSAGLSRRKAGGEGMGSGGEMERGLPSCLKVGGSH